MNKENISLRDKENIEESGLFLLRDVYLKGRQKKFITVILLETGKFKDIIELNESRERYN